MEILSRLVCRQRNTELIIIENSAWKAFLIFLEFIIVIVSLLSSHSFVLMFSSSLNRNRLNHEKLRENYWMTLFPIWKTGLQQNVSLDIFCCTYTFFYYYCYRFFWIICKFWSLCSPVNYVVEQLLFVDNMDYLHYLYFIYFFKSILIDH